MAATPVALAIGYQGDGFRGSQVQPDVPTVEGVVNRVLNALKWRTGDQSELARGLVLGSRTDGGVHARMNTGRLLLPEAVLEHRDLPSIVRIMNQQLPAEVVVWGAARVDRSWGHRSAVRRTYRYLLTGLEGWAPDAAGVAAIATAADLFTGTHDLSPFVRRDPTRDPVRHIEAIEPWLDRDGVTAGFTISAPGFLWQQVRRLATLIVGLRTQRHDADDVVAALAGDAERLGPLAAAPARRLILWSIEQDGHALHEHLPATDHAPAAASPIPLEIASRAPHPRDLELLQRQQSAAALAALSQSLHEHWQAALARLLIA